MLIISDRLHITKEKEDTCNIKILIYNYIVRPQDLVTLKIYEPKTNLNVYSDVEIVTTLNAIDYNGTGVFFNIPNTILQGCYKYEVTIKNEEEEQTIIYDRRFEVC